MEKSQWTRIYLRSLNGLLLNYGEPMTIPTGMQQKKSGVL